MAEYWKSTPKYWCKHCSTYVKDNRFERTQHEATGRHQGNLRRFLRGIHNDHEKDEREKQRAKLEVDRLNRAVHGASTSLTQGIAHTFRRESPASVTQSSVADRKRQMAQLAEMGVAVPDEYRGQMALAGDWQVVSQESVEWSQQIEREPLPGVGIRKRKLDRQEEDVEAGGLIQKKKWGCASKEYPSNDQDDLDVLLAGSIIVKKEQQVPTPKQEDCDELTSNQCIRYNGQVNHATPDVADKVQVKQEDVSVFSASPGQIPEQSETVSPGPLEIMFKKRRSKNTRPK